MTSHFEPGPSDEAVLKTKRNAERLSALMDAMEAAGEPPECVIAASAMASAERVERHKGKEAVAPWFFVQGRLCESILGLIH